MPSAPTSHVVYGPRLVVLGMWIVIAAQIFPTVPIAGAIAICGWGTALCSGRAVNAALALLIYAPLAALAVTAQLHASSPITTNAAIVDGSAAVALIAGLARWTLQRLG